MNTKWDYLEIGKLTNSGHFDFVSNILNEAKKVSAIAAKCAAELAALEAAVDEEDDALMHSIKSPFTKDLSDNDTKRDRRYVNVAELTRAYSKWPEEMPQKKAADRVLEILNLYKVNIQAQVNKETGSMTNLLQELQGELAADIETLGLTPIVAMLAENNAEVIRLYNERLWADSTKVASRVSKAREAVDKCYAALREKVNALVIVFGAEDYSAFLGYVNQRILQANRQQLGVNKKKTETTGDTGSSSTGDNTSNTDNTDTDNQPSNPDDTNGDTNGDTEPTLYTITFKSSDGTVIATKQYAEGEAIVAPTAPSGSSWGSCPATMPARDVVVTAVINNDAGV